MILLIQYFLCVHVLTTTYTHSFLIIIVILLRIIISQIIPFEDISKFQKHFIDRQNHCHKQSFKSL